MAHVTTKYFPCGFRSWLETHHEIVRALTLRLADDTYTGPVLQVGEQEGCTGLYNLAERLTDEFELKHSRTFWDGQFYDEIEKFIDTYTNF